MLDSYLVHEKTVVTAKGESAALELGGAAAKTLLLTLTITRIVEQESLDVSVWGSADGAAWEPEPLLVFPQKFYRGEHPLLLDLSSRPQVRFLQGRWVAGRWGRGTEMPMFEFQLRVREVPPEILEETTRALAAQS